jgi:hypothetical protein
MPAPPRACLNRALPARAAAATPAAINIADAFWGCARVSGKLVEGTCIISAVCGPCIHVHTCTRNPRLQFTGPWIGTVPALCSSAESSASHRLETTHNKTQRRPSNSPFCLSTTQLGNRTQTTWQSCTPRPRCYVRQIDTECANLRLRLPSYTCSSCYHACTCPFCPLLLLTLVDAAHPRVHVFEGDFRTVFAKETRVSGNFGKRKGKELSS